METPIPVAVYNTVNLIWVLSEITSRGQSGREEVRRGHDLCKSVQLRVCKNFPLFSQESQN